MDKELIVPGTLIPTKKKNKDSNTDSVDRFAKYRDHQININESELASASKYIRDRADMNSDIMKLVPELKQARNILNSSVVSPNDFSKKELIPYFDNTLGLSETIISKIKNNIISVAVSRYDMIDTIYNVVDECFFYSGASIKLIIPKNMVDSVIKDSVITDVAKSTISKSFDLESIGSDSIKLESIGEINIDCNHSVNEKKKSLTGSVLDVEGKLSDFDIEFSGNPLSMALNSINTDITDDALKNKHYNLAVDAESIDLQTLNIYDKFKKKKTKSFISLGEVDSKAIKGDVPFSMDMPSAATLPITIDRPNNHMGYIVLADEMFRNISNMPSDGEIMSSIVNFKSVNKNNVLEGMISKASADLDVIKDAPKILSNMLEITETILLQTVESSVSQNKYYKSKTNLNQDNSLVRIMLYRALNNMKTKLLFIPKQYVSYIAFDYRDNGTGKSLLEDVTMLASFKAMLTLSELYAAVNKNIPVTTIIATIDDDCPEPFKMKEIMEQDIYTSNNRRMLMGETSMERHVNWINNSRYQVIWKHKTFPNNDIEKVTENNNFNYTVDTETSTRILGSILKTLGLTPSTLDNSENTEFASVEMIKNALFHKTNSERQNVLSEGLSERLRMYILSDTILLDEIYDIIDANSATIIRMINSTLDEKDIKLEKLDDGIKTQILKDIIDSMGVRLPIAENKLDSDSLKDKFDDYEEAITKVLDLFKNTTYIKDVLAETNLSEDVLVNNLKLYYLLDWCEKHNYAADIVSFTNIRDNKELKQIMSVINGKDANIIKLAKSISKEREKVLKNINADDIDLDKTDDETPGTKGLDENSDSDTPPEIDDKTSKDEEKNEWE